MTPQETVERALALSKADGCVVLATERSEANLRWANNSLTTNGSMRSRRLRRNSPSSCRSMPPVSSRRGSQPGTGDACLRSSGARRLEA